MEECANPDRSTLSSNARRWPVWVAAVLIVLAGAVAYRNSFDVPLLFDDEVSIRDNPSIHDLAQLGRVLTPPPKVFTGGRPLLNLSFALNYAWGGTAVRGYHAVNLLIHVLAGLTLFGLARRLLQSPRVPERFQQAALPLSLAIALLWLLHPVQTESVTYLSQRAESLMGLWYLLTLYGALRAASADNAWRWAAVAISACLLGMATKEAMVTAPALVVLLDRAFVYDSFRQAWHRRRQLYLGLVATWLFLAWLMLSSHLSARGVGFSQGVAWWTYARAELRVVVKYLQLALWPHPLVFDYGEEMYLASWFQALPYAAVVLALLAAVVAAARRSLALGVLGGTFFLLIAPSSSVVPIAVQPMAESRLYLPLAPVITIVVLAAYRFVGRKALLGLGLAALGLGALTVARNRDYRSAASIWEDTVAKRPDSARAHNSFGKVLESQPGRLPYAIAHFETSLRIKPDDAIVHNNLGMALSRVPGRTPEAVAHYEAALRIKPHYAYAHNNLANILAQQPQALPMAYAHYETAVRLEPDNPQFHFNFGLALAQTPARLPEAIAHYETALRLKPNFTDAYRSLGLAIESQPGRLAEAIAHFQMALRLDPGDAVTHYHLGNALMMTDARQPEAIRQFQIALRLKPDFMEAHNNLAIALAQSGRIDEAIRGLEAAVKLDSAPADLRRNLEKLKSLRSQ
jgi:protein O-mannosyl-transferase